VEEMGRIERKAAIETASKDNRGPGTTPENAMREMRAVMRVRKLDNSMGELYAFKERKN
jgi:hypothetical protein